MENGISEVTEKRTFTFYPDDTFEIVEILQEPDISMEWTWEDTICPHCKYPMTHKGQHKFARIEILANIKIKKEMIKLEDLVFLGDTYDNRRMLLTAEKIQEVLQKSKSFSYLGGIK